MIKKRKKKQAKVLEFLRFFPFRTLLCVWDAIWKTSEKRIARINVGYKKLDPEITEKYLVENMMGRVNLVSFQLIVKFFNSPVSCREIPWSKCLGGRRRRSSRNPPWRVCVVPDPPGGSWVRTGRQGGSIWKRRWWAPSQDDSLARSLNNRETKSCSRARGCRSDCEGRQDRFHRSITPCRTTIDGLKREARNADRDVCYLMRVKIAIRCDSSARNQEASLDEIARLEVYTFVCCLKFLIPRV